MAEFIKSQSPQELWKASLKPQDPLDPENLLKNPFDPKSSAVAGEPVPASKAPGTGLVVDISA